MRRPRLPVLFSPRRGDIPLKIPRAIFRISRATFPPASGGAPAKWFASRGDLARRELIFRLPPLARCFLERKPLARGVFLREYHLVLRLAARRFLCAKDCKFFMPCRTSLFVILEFTAYPADFSPEKNPCAISAHPREEGRHRAGGIVAPMFAPRAGKGSASGKVPSRGFSARESVAQGARGDFFPARARALSLN